MKPKKCCYMEREYTDACVAYSVSSELGEGAKEMGMNNMHCMRLLMDIAEIMNTPYSAGSEDEDEF
ncbi:Uncharacterised protein [uncultured archaeon]|nr:Uncharacterised protein [uncultured archaeon]